MFIPSPRREQKERGGHQERGKKGIGGERGVVREETGFVNFRRHSRCSTNVHSWPRRPDSNEVQGIRVQGTRELEHRPRGNKHWELKKKKKKKVPFPPQNGGQSPGRTEGEPREPGRHFGCVQQVLHKCWSPSLAKQKAGWEVRRRRRWGGV